MINDINLNLYRVFYICAKCDSFVEASRKLYVSQPAVSKQIKNLEDLLGTKLFYRNNNGLRLTKDGKQLYDYSWRIFKFMPLREKAVTNKDEFNISMEEYLKVVKTIKNQSNIKNIDTRIQEDMEKKYILILANGDIVVTSNGIDKKVGNALVNSLSKFI